MSETYANEKAAVHYDSARELPAETLAQLGDRLRALIPSRPLTRMLDLGGGTGRFAGLLREVFGCPVIVADPSEHMLRQGISRGIDGVCWVRASAEYLPVLSGSVNLVWMSQVFHHLDDRVASFREISRVLSPKGYLVVRNGTRENDAEIEWYKFFPEARLLDEGRIPSRNGIAEFANAHGFETRVIQTLYQLFASSYLEYSNKIGRRGLSSLISISDEAFRRGLQNMQRWAAAKTPGLVREPVDLFVFQRIV